MVKKRTLSPLPLFDESAMTSIMTQRGIKVSPHLKTLWKFYIQNPTGDISSLVGIPTALHTLLTEQCAVLTSHVVEKHISVDGTIKLLIALQDEHQVEAVIMRHSGRNTLCVSSQVGCQMGCTFCATGTMGIIADLSSGEILEQVVHANVALREEQVLLGNTVVHFNAIRNVVFMGMGEPLNNYDAVLESMRGMTHSFRIAPKHITLSTVGVIHRMKQLKRVCIQLNILTILK